MKYFARITLFAFAASLVAGLAQAQNPNQENDLVLARGIDIIYGYSDPSIGSPVGTFPPDWANSDYFWKVIPRQSLRNATGTMEISGIDFFSFDTDYTTMDAGGNNTLLQDIIVSTGIQSVTNPGQIEPDPNDPNLVVLNFGAGTPSNNAFLPDPGCAPAGFINGYQLEVQIGTGVGDGILVTSNGATDYVVTHMIPSGMCSGGACPGTGACLDGDMTFQDAHSSCLFGGLGEEQADWLGSGYSAFGGFANAGALGGTDAVCETPWSNVEFVQRTIQGRVDLGAGNGPAVGLAGLHVSVGSGTVKYGVEMYARQAVGNLAFAAGSLFPPLPGAGIPVLGANVLLNPADPTFNLLLGAWKGTVTLSDNGLPPAGDPFDDGFFQSAMLSVPASAAGLTLTVQGYTFNLASFTASETQAFSTKFEP